MLELMDQATFGALMFTAGYLSREVITILGPPVGRVLHRGPGSGRNTEPPARPNHPTGRTT